MRVNENTKLSIAMILGMIGCLCYGGGDWLMLYGSPAHEGIPYWLTEGVIEIAPWRNNLAMALAFPGILCYGAALFYLQNYIKEEKERKIYHYLNAFGLTPWMCLHLFYIMILYLYSWMNGNGHGDIALETCAALFDHLSWIVTLSEAFMLPVFLYWFFLQIRGKTRFAKGMAFTNVFVIYGVLDLFKSGLPESAFKIGFTNGLMSESMILFFAITWIAGRTIESLGEL